MARKELSQPNWYGGDGTFTPAGGFDSNSVAANGNGHSYAPNSRGQYRESDGLISPEERGTKLAFSQSNPVSLSSRNANDEEFLLTERGEKGKPLEEQPSPPDRYQGVYLIMMIHGIGVLMSWNMFITAKSYFEDYKLTIPGQPQSEYAKNFMSYLGLCSQGPNLLFNFLNLFVQFGGSLSKRIIISIIIIVLVFIGTVILAIVDTSEWPKLFFVLTMLSAVVINSANGVYQNSIYGLAADFPAKYSNAVVLGNNISGTFAAIIGFVSMLAAPDQRTAAIYYFIAAIFVSLICFDSYFMLPLCRFYRHYKNIADSKKRKAHALALKNRQHAEGDCCAAFGHKLRPYGQVFKTAWPQMFNVFFVFFVTLTIFPAIQSDIKPLAETILGVVSNQYFTVITTFLFFNFFAMLGNVAANWVTFPGPRWLWLPVLLRALFIPYFMLCNYRPEYRTFPVYINNDYAYVCMGVLMAFTSGYFSSLSMMFAPRTVTPDKAGLAGMMAAFFLILGIFSGLYFTLVVAHINENFGPLLPLRNVTVTA